jgi:hypothetical protein
LAERNQLPGGKHVPHKQSDGVDTEPNKDGDNTMQVTCADGTAIDVTIDLPVAQKLVEILQRRLVHWAHEAAKNLRFPQSEVIDVALSYAGQGRN